MSFDGWTEHLRRRRERRAAVALFLFEHKVRWWLGKHGSLLETLL